VLGSKLLLCSPGVVMLTWCALPAQTKIKGGKKDEAGAMYEKWSKQQRRRIPVSGTLETKHSGFDASLADRC